MIRVSIGTTKEYRAIVVTAGNYELAVDVSKYQFNSNKRNSRVLEDVLLGLKQAVAALEQNNILPSLEEYFIVEVKNQHVISWLNNYKVPAEHADLMVKVTGVLDAIPYRLKFVYAAKPKAECYANKQTYNKHKEVYSTSLDAFMSIEDN